MKHVFLSEVAKIIMGQSPPSPTYNKSRIGLPFYQGNADFGDLYTIPRVYCSAPQKVAEPGDILITVRAPVGPTNLNREISCIGRGLSAIRTGNKLDRNYLLYFLRYFEPNMEKLATGSTFSAISRDDLENIVIPLPPLSEQQRIANILKKADRLRSLRKYARQLSDGYLQSVFLEMFGDPTTNPKGWEKVEIGNFLKVISGHGFKYSEYSSTGVRLLQIANVSFQEIPWDTIAYLPLDYIKKYPNLVLHPDDLVMALNRPILGDKIKFSYLSTNDCPSILYQRVGKLVVDKTVNKDFVFGFMQTNYFFNELKRRLAGSDQPYINPTELVKIIGILPPRHLQDEFSLIFQKYMSLGRRLRESERHAEILFQSLMHKAFQGEL